GGGSSTAVVRLVCLGQVPSRIGQTSVQATNAVNPLAVLSMIWRHLEHLVHYLATEARSSTRGPSGRPRSPLAHTHGFQSLRQVVAALLEDVASALPV